MWRYRCPICKEMVEKPDMGREDVKRIAGQSIYCPHCNGRLYVEASGATVDLAGAIVNFLWQFGGIIISREEVLANYYDVIAKRGLDCPEEEAWDLLCKKNYEVLLERGLDCPEEEAWGVLGKKGATLLLLRSSGCSEEQSDWPKINVIEKNLF